MAAVNNEGLEIGNDSIILGVHHESREAAETDLATRLLFTYRTEFESIGEGWRAPSSDTGWGCMHRSGQMMLAEAFMRAKFGRGFRYPRGTPLDHDAIEVIRLFYDTPSAPFSIHRMSAIGSKICGKAVGEWFGPNTLCTVFETMWKEMREFGDPISRELAIVACQEASVYSSDVEHIPPSTPFVLLIPLRPGLDELQAEAVPQLENILNFPETLGFVGGREFSAFWFVGTEGRRETQPTRVRYLDPHVTQLHSISPNIPTFFPTRTYTTPLANVNPSLALGFFCESREGLDGLMGRFERLSPSVSHSLISTGIHRPVFRDIPISNDSDDDFVLM